MTTILNLGIRIAQIQQGIAELRALLPKIPVPDGMPEELAKIIERINGRHLGLLRNLAPMGIVNGMQLVNGMIAEREKEAAERYVGNILSTLSMADSIMEKNEDDRELFNDTVGVMALHYYLDPQWMLCECGTLTPTGEVKSPGRIFESQEWEEIG